MTSHSSILAWKIPWTEEPGGYKESDMTEHKHNAYQKIKKKKNCMPFESGIPL